MRPGTGVKKRMAGVTGKKKKKQGQERWEWTGASGWGSEKVEFESRVEPRGYARRDVNMGEGVCRESSVNSVPLCTHPDRAKKNGWGETDASPEPRGKAVETRTGKSQIPKKTKR